MRIVIWSEAFAPSSADSNGSLEEPARWLSVRGHEVRVVTRTPAGVGVRGGAA